MATRTDIDALSKSAVLRDLPRQELEQLAAGMRHRTYRRGEVVFHQGDTGKTLHVVCQGRLKVVLPSEGGEEAVLAIIGPGDLFGEMALLDGGPRSATVEALEPVETTTLDREDFLELLERSPPAVRGLLAALARTIRQTDEDVGDLVFLDLQARLAKKLLELAEAHGRPSDGAGGTEIALPITQEDLAGMIGATRPTVNRLLSYYEERGVIARGSRRIIVQKPEVLRRRVNF
jgi:CRP/FNR family transcriptional regulator, cyclic AMP receptor protein